VFNSPDGGVPLRRSGLHQVVAAHQKLAQPTHIPYSAPPNAAPCTLLPGVDASLRPPSLPAATDQPQAIFNELNNNSVHFAVVVDVTMFYSVSRQSKKLREHLMLNSVLRYAAFELDR